MRSSRARAAGHRHPPDAGPGSWSWERGERVTVGGGARVNHGGLAQKEQDIDIQRTPRESNAPPDVCGPRGGPVLWNIEY